MSDVHVTGMKELGEFLTTLAPKLQANIMRAALRAGANVVRDAARAAVPVKSGLLRKGLTVSTRSKGGKVTASLKAKGKHAYIAHILEFGAAAHRIKPKNGGALRVNGRLVEGVNHPGIRPKPFMRPALDAKAQAATLAVAEAIKSKLTAQGINTADVEINAS